jgi:hypothetical protein
MGAVVYVARAESVPYSNQDWVCRPFGITVPFRMALFGDIEVAASVVTIGDEPEPLVSPPPPPPPPQPMRNMARRRKESFFTGGTSISRRLAGG